MMPSCGSRSLAQKYNKNSYGVYVSTAADVQSVDEYSGDLS